jgi:hypothetical protein
VNALRADWEDAERLSKSDIPEAEAKIEELDEQRQAAEAAISQVRFVRLSLH